MIEIKNGSEKQIAWAEKIRESELAQLDTLIWEVEEQRKVAVELNGKEGESETRNTSI